MPGEPDIDRRRREIIEDHNRLGVLLRVVRSPSRDLGRLGETLEHLREVLLRHFEREEGPDGLFEIISNRLAICPELDRLRDDHRQLLENLDDIVMRVRSGDRLRAETWVEVFVASLQNHEKRESRLLIAALSANQ